MQELDRNKKYNIKNSSEKQLLEVIEWLRKNDRGWEYINLSDFEGEKTLYFDGEEWITSLELMDGAVELLEPNRWYKSNYGTEFLVYAEEMRGAVITKGYGFDDDGKWCSEVPMVIVAVLATKEEVEERLKQEAIKRGFVVGAKIGCLKAVDYFSEIESEDYYLDGYLDEVFWNTFCVCGSVIMKDGVWLEIENKELPPYKESPTLVGDVIKGTETTDEVTPINLSSIFNAREEKLKKTLKYLLKKGIILTPKQYKKLWKK